MKPAGTVEGQPLRSGVGSKPVAREKPSRRQRRPGSRPLLAGTTFLRSHFLALSNCDWTLAPSAVLAWPEGIAAVGNEGMASMVQRTHMSIGYVEYAYAQQHSSRVAVLRNLDGVSVKSGAESFRAGTGASRRSRLCAPA